MADSSAVRRRRRSGASVVARFAPGNQIPAGGSFTRSTTATYTQDVPDLQAKLVAGGSTVGATITRSTTATYTTGA